LHIHVKSAATSSEFINFRTVSSPNLLSGLVEDDPAAWHGGVRGRELLKTAGDSDEDF
jgi:hypothetical protein